ncbi:isoprenyl transferase [Vibrio gallicus]|uniref:isoprenyl transferase n=1 Tax=Vibrio gallicus TaxID=190897 RepID=UPI0021C378D5|nr:isoprenyl transferase [Vibrio gallicus]
MSDSSLSNAALPQHIAIIMDGNGRWAKAQGKPRVYGHKKGVTAVRKTITTAAKLGIKAVTLFAFSSENWRRPQAEVGLLMDLFITLLSKEIKRLHKNDLKLQIIGDKSRFSDKLQKKIAEAEQLTKDNKGLVINIAANYGGKWDIVQATRKLAEQAVRGEIQTQDISEQLMAECLSLSDLPDVDLMIRTSGESRLSNFLLWQVAYAEFYFCDTNWPDFDEDTLSEAISWFVNRERRFGCTGEQIKALMAQE